MPSREDVALARALERCEVPDAGFPHARHLRVAWVYLAESASVDEAIARMASTLRRFAESVGKAGKYSQATTEFWMHQVAAVRAVMPGADVDAALRAYPRLLDKDAIVANYSNDDAAAGSSHPSSDAPDRPLSRRPA
jgi:hypothetical protein